MQCLPHNVTLAASTTMLGHASAEEAGCELEAGARSRSGARLEEGTAGVVGVRECVVPAAGHVLLSVDYSQLELRIIGHYSQVRRGLYRIISCIRCLQTTFSRSY